MALDLSSKAKSAATQAAPSTAPMAAEAEFVKKMRAFADG
jgi:hypothetical protein